jgi:hypothetical protein
MTGPGRKNSPERGITPDFASLFVNYIDRTRYFPYNFFTLPRESQTMLAYYKTVLLLAALLLLFPGISGAHAAAPLPGTAAATVTNVVLLPGDSRTVELEYWDTIWWDGSCNVAIISAIIPDNEIHYLRVSFTPRDERAADIGYFTTGSFIYTNQTTTGLLQFLEPRLTYGAEATSYIIDVYPSVSAGIVFSAVILEYQDFDFPFKMTLTATLSN